jgi:hypothetical protein
MVNILPTLSLENSSLVSVYMRSVQKVIYQHFWHIGEFATRCFYCLLPSVFCLLPSAFCLLPSAFCLLPSVFCLLSSAFCHLSSVGCKMTFCTRLLYRLVIYGYARFNRHSIQQTLVADAAKFCQFHSQRRRTI